MQSFEKLKVWERSHRLVLAVFRATKAFPREERFEMTSQLRRAVASVPTNIAEGTKRQTARDYARFLNIAEGSLAETRYLLILARDLGYGPPETFADLLDEANGIGRMLNALRARVDPASNEPS